MGMGSARDAEADTGPGPFRLPGVVLGIGLGGFVDGFLLYRLLRWHRAPGGPGSEMNTARDAVLHAACWLAVLGGLALLHSRVTRRRRRVWGSRVLWGWILVGWGSFDLVEGVLDHHLLGVHHVRGGPGRAWWDLGFLALGALLVVAGYLLQRGGAQSGGAQSGGGSGVRGSGAQRGRAPGSGAQRGGAYGNGARGTGARCGGAHGSGARGTGAQRGGAQDGAQGGGGAR